MNIRSFLQKRRNLFLTPIITTWAEPYVTDYVVRVDDNFGKVEDETSLITDLETMTEQEYTDAIALYYANGGYRGGKIYDVRDTDNTSPNDLTVVGGGGTRINEAGQVEKLLYNRFDRANPPFPWLNVNDYTITSATAPDGSQDAARVQLDGTSQIAWRILSYNSTSGTTNFSQYIKKVVSTSNAQFRMVLNGSKGCGFDLNTGTVNLSVGGAVGTMTDVGNGWYRCSMTITGGGGDTVVFEFVNQNIGDTYDWWGRQHTLGSELLPLQITTPSGNFAKIDYSTGQPAYLIEPESTNFLLNSETLGTQSYTTSAIPYTLSFYGTGSITLSGSHSETLVGTGANDRVTTTFTPTAASLTLTVSGTVTNAQLEEGSNATTYIPTTGATVTRPESIVSITTPVGVTSIIETIDGVEQPPITTIPSTYQMPQGNINKVEFR